MNEFVAFGQLAINFISSFYAGLIRRVTAEQTDINWWLDPIKQKLKC